MKRLFILIFAATLALPSTLNAQMTKGDYEWLDHIRTDHPRLFLTADDIPNIINAAQTYESRTFNTLKKRIDDLMSKEIVFKYVLMRDGDKNKNALYGYRTSEAAMLWLITREQKYLDFTVQMIRRMTDYYKLRAENNLNIYWYFLPQFATLCAYDWIYNDLPADERDQMGRALYEVLNDVAWHGKGIRRSRYRENNSGPWSGLYGASALPFYLGLTFLHDGIDDEACRKMLRNCYDLHQEMTECRAILLGKDGGSSSGTVGYGLGAYPYAEYDLIYNFRSAMGIDITPQMQYMLGYLPYMDWIRLPGNREFGIGDAHHTTSKLPNISVHISEIANLFADSNPSIVPYARQLLARYNSKAHPSVMTFMPLLHRVNIGADHTPVYPTKKSAIFSTLGQIYMRSGVGDNDTYAVFTTERSHNNHQHFDINNFIIYKHGYRALDSGTRPQPGIHLSHYYCRTVAHNCITIRMPDEEMPKYWGRTPAKGEDRDTPYPNDGGQRDNMAGKLLAYEEQPDWVYIASDATKCYHEDKAEQVVREFVWCPDDIFVIFDRVVSDNKDYPKKWLYHTAGKPAISGKQEFTETSQGGKSICRTLLPKKVSIELIGGDGKQFWSDGRNWPIPEPPAYKKKQSTPLNQNPLFGQWRVEVSPSKAAEKDFFLHILQVGDESLKALPKTKCSENNESVTLSFDYNGRHYKLTFDKCKNYGCNIEVTPLASQR